VPPRDPHDAHRPLRGDEDLDHLFSWRVDRRMPENLTVHFKRRAYLVTPSKETLPLGRTTVRVHEWEDGRVEIHWEGRVLAHTVFDKNPIVSQGAIVENERLGAVLAAIQASQAVRDRERLASRSLTLREKELLASGPRKVWNPPPGGPPQAQEPDIST